MPKIYYDTEFIDDGITIELISIGMVSDLGEEYYGINGELSLTRLREHPWHVKNTVPSLPIGTRTDGKLGWDISHPDATLIMSRNKLRREVSDFILKHNLFRTDPVELWAWYGAYDHVALAQLFGPMVNLPKHIPMWTNDLKQEMSRKEKLGNSRLRFNMPMMDDGNLHNALDDARLLKKRAEWLAKF